MGVVVIKNGTIINEGERFRGTLIIRNGIIEQVIKGDFDPIAARYTISATIDAEGLYVIPGIIDTHVHFREPGLTDKGDIRSESRAAAAGGITSFMDMPNTAPPTTTLERLEQKMELASKQSVINYSFYLGATNDNLDQITKLNPARVGGVKAFLGSSTGNMLIDNAESLERLFNQSPVLIAAHCEDEKSIRTNQKQYKERYGETIPFKYHAEIRSREACYLSSSFAVGMARKNNSRLHILHLSTREELELFDNRLPLTQKQITGEACVHHLWFNDSSYNRLTWRVKWNPSIKTESDRKALIDAINNNSVDVVSTDHAPHQVNEKSKSYFQAASGGPMVQHSLIAMLELAKRGYFTVEKAIEKMCHAPAILFRIEKRGFIREGYYADIALVNPQTKYIVTKNNLLYKCNWSPLEGEEFSHSVQMTMVNGTIIYNNGKITNTASGKALEFSNTTS